MDIEYIMRDNVFCKTTKEKDLLGVTISFIMKVSKHCWITDPFKE